MVTGFKNTYNMKPKLPNFTKEQAIEVLNLTKEIITSEEYIKSSEKETGEDYKYILALKKYNKDFEKDDYLRGFKWSLRKYKEDPQVKELLEEITK